MISSELAANVRVETSVDPDRTDSSSIDTWWLTASTPFATLSKFTGTDTNPTTVTVWHGAVYCCRGAPAPQFAIWNAIESLQPYLYRPSDFKRISSDESKRSGNLQAVNAFVIEGSIGVRDGAVFVHDYGPTALALYQCPKPKETGDAGN